MLPTACSSAPSGAAPTASALTTLSVPRAAGSACAGVVAHLPGTVLDQPRHAAGTPGSASWGEPAIVLRCGLAPLGPTTQPCLSVDDVDWVVEQAADGVVFTTFGRDPGVQVRVPASYGQTNASAALVDVGAAVATLPTRDHCVA